MNAITTIRPAVATPKASVYVPFKFTGKGKEARSNAFVAIAPRSYSESVGRGETIATLRTALGNKPSADVLLAARTEWMAGRIAFRLPAGEFKAGMNEPILRIDFARSLILDYATAPKPGATVRKLRKGKLGYRSPMQQKCLNAAQEAWSQLLAEIGLNSATPQSERDAAKAKRAPQMAGSTARGKAGAVPSNAQLVKAPTPMTADEACQHVVGQALALMQFCKKNAKLVPTDIATLVNAFHAATVKADSERRVNAK